MIYILKLNFQIFLFLNKIVPFFKFWNWTFLFFSFYLNFSVFRSKNIKFSRILISK